MSAGRYVTLSAATVEITVAENAPDDVFTRMESGDLPANLYGVMDRDQVLAHWSYNALRNGVTDASALDGWADMDRNMVTFDVTDVDDTDVESFGATS